MTRLPVVDFKTMDRLLRKLGFDPVRQRGSHIFYRHAGGRTTTLPSHPGRDLARPLVREILREIEITVEQYREHLDNL